MVNDKISAALASEPNAEKVNVEPQIEEIVDEPASKIVTTEDEIEAFYIIRGILAGILPVEDVTYKDTESYFGILYKGNIKKNNM